MKNKKKSWIWIWGLMFLAWIPGLLAAWPGVFVVDNVFQMKWYLEGTISAHHPILHTYLLGGCLKLGKQILGSYEAGVALLAVLQMLFLSFVFAYVLHRLKDRFGKGRPGKIVWWMVLVYFALMPYHSISAVTTTKDTIFAGFFLLVVWKTYEMVKDQKSFFASWKQAVEYVILTFLMCGFRNTGIYIFLFTLPSMLIVCRKYWKRVLALGLSVVVLWGIFTGPVYERLGITKGSSAEMLCVPIQQLSRVMVDAPEELTEKQQAQVEAYIPDYSKYISAVADPAKDTFNVQLFEMDPGRFVKLWIQVGLKCPVVYVEAFLATNEGFWNPFAHYPNPDTYLPYIPYHGADLDQVGISWEHQIFIRQTPVGKGLDWFYEKMTEAGSYNRIPLLSLLYSAATAFWLIVVGIIVCIRKKRYEMAVPFFLLIGLWGTLMLSPVVVFRYGYPLLICLPVVWSMCCNKTDGKL